MPDRPGVNWEAPLAVRLDHRARHSPRMGREPLKTLWSLAREFGDFVWGAFTPIKEAY